MSLQVQQPIIYLITSGATNAQTTPASEEFAAVLKLVAAAVSAKVSLIQLREKQVTARTLYELTTRAVQLTQGSDTRLLVNDRADIARAAGADGVHLTAHSLPAEVIRSMFGAGFLIGVSTHSLAEAQWAGTTADFAVWGPVFATESKHAYGQPQGVAELASVVQKTEPFPIVALGGINLDNFAACAAAGASGIAGIGLFQDAARLTQTVRQIRDVFEGNDRKRKT